MDRSPPVKAIQDATTGRTGFMVSLHSNATLHMYAQYSLQARSFAAPSTSSEPIASQLASSRQDRSHSILCKSLSEHGAPAFSPIPVSNPQSIKRPAVPRRTSSQVGLEQAQSASAKRQHHGSFCGSMSMRPNTAFEARDLDQATRKISPCPTGNVAVGRACGRWISPDGRSGAREVRRSRGSAPGGPARRVASGRRAPRRRPRTGGILRRSCSRE